METKVNDNTEITPEYINSLPQLNFEGNIYVVDTASELEQVMEKLSECGCIGFDTESRPSFVKGQKYPISLLQLATPTDAYIVQIQKTGFTDSLKAFFESKTEKIGVGLKDDIRKLKSEREFTPAAMVDLSEIAKKKNHIKSGLRALSAFFLHKRIVKSAQKTNWARDNLTEKQLRYAATDAWACLLIKPLLEQSEALPVAVSVED